MRRGTGSGARAAGRRSCWWRGRAAEHGLSDHPEGGPVHQPAFTDLAESGDLGPGLLVVAGSVRRRLGGAQLRELVARDLGREQVSMMGGHGGRELAAAMGPDPPDVDGEPGLLLGFPDSLVE